jgi:hypothetical protein
MPDKRFICIWEKEVRSNMSGSSKVIKAKEKIFVNKHGYKAFALHKLRMANGKK